MKEYQTQPPTDQTEMPTPDALYPCTHCRDEYSRPADDLYWSEKTKGWVCSDCWDDEHDGEDRGVRLDKELKGRAERELATATAKLTGYRSPEEWAAMENNLAREAIAGSSEGSGGWIPVPPYEPHDDDETESFDVRCVVAWQDADNPSDFGVEATTLWHITRGDFNDDRYKNAAYKLVMDAPAFLKAEPCEVDESATSAGFNPYFSEPEPDKPASGRSGTGDLPGQDPKRAD